jgi:hypothetical protein
MTIPNKHQIYVSEYDTQITNTKGVENNPGIVYNEVDQPKAPSSSFKELEHDLQEADEALEQLKKVKRSEEVSQMADDKTVEQLVKEIQNMENEKVDQNVNSQIDKIKKGVDLILDIKNNSESDRSNRNFSLKANITEINNRVIIPNNNLTFKLDHKDLNNLGAIDIVRTVIKSNDIKNSNKTEFRKVNNDKIKEVRNKNIKHFADQDNRQSSSPIKKLAENSYNNNNYNNSSNQKYKLQIERDSKYASNNYTEDLRLANDTFNKIKINPLSINNPITSSSKLEGKVNNIYDLTKSDKIEKNDVKENGISIKNTPNTYNLHNTDKSDNKFSHPIKAITSTGQAEINHLTDDLTSKKANSLVQAQLQQPVPNKQTKLEIANKSEYLQKKIMNINKTTSNKYPYNINYNNKKSVSKMPLRKLKSKNIIPNGPIQGINVSEDSFEYSPSTIPKRFKAFKEFKEFNKVNKVNTDSSSNEIMLLEKTEKKKPILEKLANFEKFETYHKQPLKAESQKLLKSVKDNNKIIESIINRQENIIKYNRNLNLRIRKKLKDFKSSPENLTS